MNHDFQEVLCCSWLARSQLVPLAFQFASHALSLSSSLCDTDVEIVDVISTRPVSTIPPKNADGLSEGKESAEPSVGKSLLVVDWSGFEAIWQDMAEETILHYLFASVMFILLFARPLTAIFGVVGVVMEMKMAVADFLLLSVIGCFVLAVRAQAFHPISHTPTPELPLDHDIMTTADVNCFRKKRLQWFKWGLEGMNAKKIALDCEIIVTENASSLTPSHLKLFTDRMVEARERGETYCRKLVDSMLAAPYDEILQIFEVSDKDHVDAMNYDQVDATLKILSVGHFHLHKHFVERVKVGLDIGKNNLLTHLHHGERVEAGTHTLKDLHTPQIWPSNHQVYEVLKDILFFEPTNEL